MRVDWFLCLVRLRRVKTGWIRMDLGIFESVFCDVLHEARGLSAGTACEGSDRLGLAGRRFIALLDEGHGEDVLAMALVNLPVVKVQSLVIDDRPRNACRHGQNQNEAKLPRRRVTSFDILER